jgi:hypothetical protein
VELGELKRDCAGLKADPYRYWLPSLEKCWESDAVTALQQTIAHSRRVSNCRVSGF